MAQHSQEQLQKIYNLAAGMQQAGHTDGEIIKALMDDGADQPTAQAIVNNLSGGSQPVAEESGGGGFPSWLVWILLLVGVNILSAIFDWGFWVY